MTLAEMICMAIFSISMPNADFACEHMETVVEYSEKSDIDPILLTALIYSESRWNPKVESRAGACGLTQVIPKWSRSVGYASGKQLKNNPDLSIKKGAQILHYWVHKYGKGDVKIGLCGYNAGFRCRGKNKISNKKGHTSYTRRVLGMHKKIVSAMPLAPANCG